MYYKKSLGALAQLVARNVRNVEVTGSNPVCSTIQEPLLSETREVFHMHTGVPVSKCTGFSPSSVN